MIYQLRTSDWFPDSHTVVVDVGLLPSQILAAKRATFVQSSDASIQMAQSLTPEIRQNLSVQELKWLEAGNFVELESFTPQQLIQVLNRSMAKGQQLETMEDSSLILISSGDFYAIESFG